MVVYHVENRGGRFHLLPSRGDSRGWFVIAGGSVKTAIEVASGPGGVSSREGGAKRGKTHAQDAPNYHLNT